MTTVTGWVDWIPDDGPNPPPDIPYRDAAFVSGEYVRWINIAGVVVTGTAPEREPYTLTRADVEGSALTMDRHKHRTHLLEPIDADGAIGGWSGAAWITHGSIRWIDLAGSVRTE